MVNPSFSSSLYNCATECALRRRNHRCRESFGAYACNNCRLNINKYIDADPRHVELFMLEAETRAGAIKASSNNYHILFILIISFCLFAAWSSYSTEKRRSERSTNNSTVSAPPSSSTQTQNEVISVTLQKVAADMNRKIDVNGDRLTNCIDAAVLFYKYYPDKSKVCIELNRNDATGMHHLFNCVFIGGVWRAIEPQAAYTNQRSYFMRDVWGARYNVSLNRDATTDYLRFTE